MSINSLTSVISLGKQSAKGTAATAFKQALATESGANPKFDERQPKLEHPSAVARATKVKRAPQRTGYVVPIESTFLLYPRFIGYALLGAGFGVVTTTVSAHKVHTFTAAVRTGLSWLSCIKQDGDTGTELKRLITDCRINKLSIDAGLEEIQCKMAGVGLAAGAVGGSETFTAETGVEISPYSGSATITINGVAYTAPLRGNTFEIANDLQEDNKVLFSSVRADLDQKSFGVTGKLQNVDIDYNTYQAYTAIVNAAGAAPSLTSAVGAISFVYNSLSLFSADNVPYSLTVTIPSAYFKLSDWKASTDNLIRTDIEYGMVDDVSVPVTIVLVNDQATY